MRSNRKRGPSVQPQEFTDSALSKAVVDFKNPKSLAKPNRLYQRGIAPELLREVLATGSVKLKLSNRPLGSPSVITH